MRIYSGTLNPAKMTPEAKQAYEIWGSQKTRNSREYSSRKFVAWWLSNLKKKNWSHPQCGRIDHSKGYFFGNIQMEERSDNTKERNARRGNPSRSHKAVEAVHRKTGKIKRFKSKVEAATFYSVSEKTVYNHCHGKSLNFVNGPLSSAREVRFRWAQC